MMFMKSDGSELDRTHHMTLADPRGKATWVTIVPHKDGPTEMVSKVCLILRNYV